MQSSKWRDAVNHVTKVAEQETSTLETLSQALGQLASALELDKISALAFIAETAAGSCTTQVFDAASVRFAVVDLCERLLISLESSLPFDFGDADQVLLSLLFPEPDAAFDSESLAQNVPVISSSEPIEIANEPRIEICPCVDAQLIKEFLNEANEHLLNAEQLMLNLETNPLDQESINELFRVVHSLKGSAGILELKSLGAISHLAESVLVKVRDSKLVLRGNQFEVILAAVDALTAQVRSLTECHQAKRTLEYAVASEVLLACLEKLNNTGEISDADLKLLKYRAGTPESQADAKKDPKSGPLADTLRVDGKRLEQLIDLIGELVITDAMVQRELHKRESLVSTSVASRLRKVVREVQQLSLALKMVPIGTMFQKMNRMVRDLSAKLNKQVELRIVGADTEVDKTLLECIADPLVHLLRNSLDHGIENTTAERIAAGKPAVASIRLEAEHRAGSIHLRLSDDGRGLNREKILARAIERGLIGASHTLSEIEIDELIFTPGFSTATEVTEISGRGVGMDVVRNNVEALRGTITINSRPGLGMDISLELPLTLSIIDGTVVRIGDQFFIIPTLSVIEQVQIASLEFSGSSDCRLTRFRSRFMQVRLLGDVLDTPHASVTKHGQVVIIVESAGKQHALIVDEVLGQQPVVIKPLGGVLAGVRYFAGGALLCDGQVGFVLDITAICGNH